MTNETIHEEKLNGLMIKIFRDNDPMQPDDWCNPDLFLTGKHRDFYIKPPKEFHPDTVFTQTNKTHWALPLEAYIHSGVHLSLAHEGNYPDRQFDVSCVGGVFVSKKINGDDKPSITKKEARDFALSLIAEWNDYLSDNVYGFQIENAGGEIIESCWGFYGDYDKNALPEARSLVESLTHKGKTDEKGQYLFEFMKS